MHANTSLLTLYAVTPCHAGSGSSLGVVDLPIQRERHTNWPVIFASGVKGAMRAHVERIQGTLGEQGHHVANLAFGKETRGEKDDRNEETGDKKGDGYAGALTVTDAKILAFPIRSDVAPFVWITSPAVLKRLQRDLRLAGRKADSLDQLKVITAGTALWVSGQFKEDQTVLLEDAEVRCIASLDLPETRTYLSDAERLLIVHDQVFDYAVSHCTAVSAHIQINSATGTTKDGSLRYQEELPADSLLYCLVQFGAPRTHKPPLDQTALSEVLREKLLAGHLQVGGDATMGRGIFALTWH